MVVALRTDFSSYCSLFSSRRRHTRWNCDWSSDVCSSDLFQSEPAGSSQRRSPEGTPAPAGKVRGLELPQTGSERTGDVSYRRILGMCDVVDDGVGIKTAPERSGGLAGDSKLQTIDIRGLMLNARALAGWRENRESHFGFVGYGNTTAGDKVLIAVDREYDLSVAEAIAQGLREKGAHIDLLVLDMGEPDREFDYLDEVRVIMRREPWENNPRRWEGLPFIEDFAARRGYDLLIHGKGGPVPKTDYRYEQIPWLQSEHFLQRSTTYQLELHLLINQKTWEPIWEEGRGR